MLVALLITDSQHPTFTFLKKENTMPKNKTIMSAQPVNDDLPWYEDDLGKDPYAERYSTKCIIGMSLAELSQWAQNLAKEYGEDSKLSDICTDEEYPNVEIEFKLPQFPED